MCMRTTPSSCKMADKKLPSQSPDTNIIKNMRSILNTTISKFNIKSSKELWNVAVKVGNDISTETINHLYETIPRLLNADHNCKY